MATIVFGSPEAKAVIDKDKEVYGDSRYPGDASEEPLTLHRWKITAICEIRQKRTYYVEAYSEAQARKEWERGDSDYNDVEDLGIVDWEHDVTVEDAGEA